MMSDFRADKQHITSKHSIIAFTYYFIYRSPVPATSTPLRARRDIFNSHRPFRDISTINSDILDDTELYRLEEETRGLQEEVARLKNLLVSSKIDS
ncbi:hypothetical protein Anas_06225 [Armadillidium nasatum]|uniref:Uncharacterized protein n=1 Tax=Armadillidium nasatum TaxID=96803 RepID=A0A5N5SST9_9CRUS|nr:hypothetical protein Anas_06225 [Armadillidium nasatum]